MTVNPYMSTFPLSALQHGMLTHHLRAPGVGVDIEQLVCTLPEAVDAGALRDAWQAVVTHHDVLRTAFRWEDVDVPQQEVRSTVEVPFAVHDLRRISGAERLAWFDAFLRQDRLLGFDLASAPLMRLALVQWADADSQLVWTFHHALLDGRSFPIVLREAFDWYDANRRSETLAFAPDLPFRTHIEWLGRHDWSAAREFWTRTLAGFHVATPLPGPPCAPVQAAPSQGDRTIQITDAATVALQQMAARAGLTLNTLVQGAWAIVLSAHAGEGDVVFGAVRAGRRSAGESAADMLGLFINTLPLRVQVDPAMDLVPWLRSVRERWNALRDYEHTPLPTVQACSGVAAGQPLFETVVMFERYDLAELLRRGGAAWAQRGVRLYEQNGFPLTLTAYNGSRLLLRLEYDASRYDVATADALLDQVTTLLEAFPEHADRPLAALSLLSAPGRQQVLESFNATVRSYPAGETLTDLLAAQAERTPDRVAVEWESGSLTFAQLGERTDTLAAWLRGRGIGRGSLVGVCMERSPELVVSLVATLKAGAAYVPLDPEYPAERLAFMLGDALVPMLLAQRRLSDRLGGFAGKLLLVDTDWDVVEAGSSTAPSSMDARATASDPAYMIYTSGSTGRPKGALNSHRGIVNRLRWMQDEYRLTATDTVLQKTPISFDVSVWEFFWPLTTGARLMLAAPGGHRDPEYLANVIERSRVTVLHFVPPMLRTLLEESAVGPRCRSVRDVICSGEALPVELTRRFFAALPWARLHNLYGPTEAAVDVSHWECRHHEPRISVPIGRPVANTQLYVLDERREPVAVGVPGELYIAGAQVGMGYHERPELTAERFVVDPFSRGPGARMYRTGDRARWLSDGSVDFLGRLDTQVKLHGQRVELGEIEAILAAQPHVTASAARVWKDERGERLVAYYVAEDGTQPTTADLYAQLARLLPPGLVPAAFLQLGALPLSPNGKLDRNALPDPGDVVRVKREFMAPRSAAEATLVGIWRDVLRVEQVSVDDNFFELGGDSLLMIQIISRARHAGLRLVAQEFFKRPTVAELAATMSQVTAPADEQGAVTGQVAFTPAQLWFLDRKRDELHYWNQAFLFTVPTDLDLAALTRAVADVTAHHDALRLRLHRAGTGWLQQVAPPMPEMLIECADLSSVPEAQLAGAIERACVGAQQSLHIDRGPLWRVLHVALGPHRPGRLLIVVHHLAVDGVSWRPLLEDLEAAYLAESRGEPLQLPRKTTSVQEWGRRLDAFARSDVLRAELSYWEAVVRTRARSLPLDHAAAAEDLEADAATVVVALGADETRALLQRVPRAYNTQANDALLTALAMALAPWVGNGSLIVDMEGHGREEVFDDVDVSRTVGWFTAFFPVRLELPLPSHPGDALRGMKEQLRSVPRRGFGFGVLRNVAGEPALAADSEVVFNYLGQLDTLVAGSSLLAFATESCGPWRGPRAQRRHRLDINALVLGGRLEVRWGYNRRTHDEATIRRLAEAFVGGLRDLIAHCTGNDASRYTPSDFPLAALEQTALDRVTAGSADIEDIYPVTAIQRLFLAYVDGDSDDPGFEQWRYGISGPLDVAALKWAWQAVVERHSALRTGFASDGVAEPLQLVHRDVTLPWAEHDWRKLDAAEQAMRLDALLRSDRADGFVPEVPPLMRVAVIRLGDEQYELIWSHHHLMLDRWSWALILRDVMALYAAARGGEGAPPAAVPYRNYVRWLASQDAAAAEEYWRGLLDGFDRPLAFRRLTAVATTAPIESGFDLTAEPTATLRSLAADWRVSVNSVVQGAWALWLAHEFNVSDVVYGVSVSGRPADLAGVDQMVGLTINNLPTRARVDPAEPLADWLLRLQAQQAEAQNYAYAPLDRIQAWSGIPWRHRLFETLLVFQNATADEDTRDWLGPDIRIERRPAPMQTRYPLSLVVTGSDRLSLRVTCDAAYFLPDTVERSLERLRTLLLGVVTWPEASLGALLDLLPPVEVRGGTAQVAETPRFPRERVAARTPAEAVIAALWGELLGHEPVGVTENFFALGGHSLLALQLVARMRETFRMDVPVGALFASPTVEGLTRALVALERRPGQVERIAELTQQVAAMSIEQLNAAASVATRAPRK
jgi:amino acid adenylation domain-containing protein/non-ribosomal peptide synthase protein (TIGR01720 family)